MVSNTVAGLRLGEQIRDCFERFFFVIGMVKDANGQLLLDGAEDLSRVYFGSFVIWK